MQWKLYWNYAVAENVNEYLKTYRFFKSLSPRLFFVYRNDFVESLTISRFYSVSVFVNLAFYFHATCQTQLALWVFLPHVEFLPITTYLKTCFQQACVWVPISRAILSSTSILNACAACKRASFGRPLSTEEITETGDAFLSAAAVVTGCWDWAWDDDDDDDDDDDAARRISSASTEHDAAARCSNTAPQRSYRPAVNIYTMSHHGQHDMKKCQSSSFSINRILQ